MLDINGRIHIPEDEFQLTFARSGGPGGQNVNKVSSKVVLRWDLSASPSVPEDVKIRLRTLQRRRITVAGELVLTSQRFRDQGRNIEDCLQKIHDMVLEAATVPKTRRPTRPTRGSREARLREKRRRSGFKLGRQQPRED